MSASTSADLLEGRKRGFQAFAMERIPVLMDFLARLGIREPEKAVSDLHGRLPAISQWLSIQTIDEEVRPWILTRVGYLIGEYLAQKFEGRWLVDDDPLSPYFTQYVVGDFNSLPLVNSRVSPFAVSNNFVDLPPGRDLISAIAKIEYELGVLITK